MLWMRYSVLLLILILPVAAVVMVAGSFGVGATLENRDSFCASCHTQPESTYVQRAAAAAPVDLASYHTAKATRCIDCHSGSGVGGRFQAELNGASNALRFFTRTDVQPGRLPGPYGDDGCLKCHADVVNQPINGNNHYHEYLARWQATSPSAGGCVSCHPAHTTDSAADNLFMTDAVTQEVCAACHQVLTER